MMHELIALVKMREDWKYEDMKYVTLRRKLCNHACCKNAHEIDWVPGYYQNPITR